MVSKFSEIVQKNEHLISLRKFLKLKLDATQKEIQHLIEGGAVFIDQKKETFGSKKLKQGQKIHFESKATSTQPKSQKQQAESIKIIWENDELLAVNKPPGIPSQKTKDSKRYSMEHWGQEATSFPLFLTHRLDRDTSGVLLFAKSKKMETECFEWFKHRHIKKVYHAIAHQKANKNIQGKWVHHLGKAPQKSGRSSFRVVHAGGLRAETDYQLIKNVGHVSFWELKPHTGRTHQLRVQLAHEGHPIIGDEIYDPKYRQRAPTPHHFLHARALFLPEQYSEQISLEADYPKSWYDNWSFLT
jgi:RluA family pseudouridine synthase